MNDTERLVLPLDALPSMRRLLDEQRAIEEQMEATILDETLGQRARHDALAPLSERLAALKDQITRKKADATPRRRPAAADERPADDEAGARLVPDGQRAR
jgi:uncharacterized small protein (DUF1192 family)